MKSADAASIRKCAEYLEAGKKMIKKTERRFDRIRSLVLQQQQEAVSSSKKSKKYLKKTMKLLKELADWQNESTNDWRKLVQLGQNQQMKKFIAEYPAWYKRAKKTYRELKCWETENDIALVYDPDGRWSTWKMHEIFTGTKENLVTETHNGGARLFTGKCGVNITLYTKS